MKNAEKSLLNGILLQTYSAQWESRNLQAICAADSSGFIGGWESSRQTERQEKLLPIYSCTKSVLSLLVGAALEEGIISDVEEPLVSFTDVFGQKAAQLDERVKIKHLLSMTSGFEWANFDKPYFKLASSMDAIDEILSKPVVHQPGAVFTYHSGCSLLLSAIITSRSRTSLLEYARKKLFDPLHIKDIEWSKLGGYYEGGTGLYLKPADLLKIGQLCLQQGKWQNNHVILPEWISMATVPKHLALTKYKPPLYGSYSFHWWWSSKERNGVANYYFAYGFSGQHLIVCPERELTIAVLRNKTNRSDGDFARQAALLLLQVK